MTNISQVELIPVTATDIARATKTDRKLFKLYESLKSGTELPVPWKGRESEFALQNGCIMYDHRVYIPEKYQNQVLEELHVGHPGIVKMKAIARSYCYWQVSDAYSKWIEVIPIKNITASFTIHHLRILFAHYGIPLTLEGEKVGVRNYSGPNKWKIGTIINRDGTLSYSIQIGNEIWKRHVDQIRKCGKSIELSQAATEIPIYDKELNFPNEPVSDDVAELEPPAPVPEVVPKPKDVPVPATPSDDIPPKPVPEASGKPKTDVPLRCSNRFRRPPKRLDL
ncbi:uncharacterized protein K02A2.6-like [Trichonephila clavipes]|nr:uncharacterized protein K02A2.6-like [Trichonephila clavipes]